MKRYLLFVSLTYSYSILRPIQEEIKRRGGEVAWYIEEPCPIHLLEDEIQLKTIKEVMEYNPIATFAPGNHIYDFFPGIKVEVFHGLYYKRTDYGDHYRIRGLFDLYCTTSSLFLPKFKELEDKYKFFKVVHTGWSKFDGYFAYEETSVLNESPVILYAPTFSTQFNSAVDLYDKIEQIIKTKNWIWIFSFHPKMDKELIDKYKNLANKYANAIFSEEDNKIPLLKNANIMLSDTSSIIYEFLWLEKPVITYKNSFPGKHLLNIDKPESLEETIELALQKPKDLMENIHNFMQIIHPYKDGKASARILDATDDFIANYKGKIKKKPLNIFRKLKLRKKAGYFPFGSRYKKVTN